MATYITVAMIWPVLTLTAIAAFFCYYWRCVLPRKGSLEWTAARRAVPPATTFAGRCHPMTKADRLPILLITLVYAATAFFQLGNTTAPRSFAGLAGGQTVELALDRQITLTKLMYYPGLGTGRYNLEISADGKTWFTLWEKKDEAGKVTGAYWAMAEGYGAGNALTQTYAQLFKWVELTPENPQYVKYLRITGAADSGVLKLGELALYDNGQLTDVTVTADASGNALFDENDLVPDRSTYMNSTYFDEIYHARTALEHLEGVYPYETSHPPLGKLILSIGIAVFGMNPFGWRVMGTLFGVLMVPILYIFLKNLFGKTPVAACGAALFAFDFMHLTQTRIATIDTYGVFFILCAYFFLYRYLVLPAGTPFKKGALPLFLAGLSFGLGAASKWIVLYAGAGLALLYFVGLVCKLRDWPKGEGAVQLGPWLAKTLLFCVLCFVLIPGAIYVASYLPYAAARGGITLQNLMTTVVDNQIFMFTYHEGVHDVHPYSSRWYQWIVDGRPILYYLDNAQTATTGLKAAFGCFNNPVVAWAGLLALGSTAVELFRRRSARALFVVVGYLSQLLPWVFIGRTTFAYHYFPSTLFLVLALSFVLNELVEAQPEGWKIPAYTLTGGTVALYALFYPVLVGLPVPEWYSTNFLRWLPSWPF